MNLAPAILSLFLAVGGCKRHGDTKITKILAGTWAATGRYRNGQEFKSTVIVDQRGNYVCELVTQRESGRVQTNTLEGTFQAEEGVLTDTVTKHSNTNAVLPMIARARIVRLDDAEMILKWDLAEGIEAPTSEVVFRRLGR